MTIDEAIRTALQYENRVVGVYEEAMTASQDPTGQKVFKTLAEEEKQHVAYLESKRREWESTGRVTPGPVESVVPSRAAIAEGIKNLKTKVAAQSRENEIQLLKRALQVEVETSDFYKRMVAELPAEGRDLFERFVQIEEGHKAIVQAELDSVSGSGFWFDFAEFNLEAG
jgi:rubrerythrin